MKFCECRDCGRMIAVENAFFIDATGRKTVKPRCKCCHEDNIRHASRMSAPWYERFEGRSDPSLDVEDVVDAADKD